MATVLLFALQGSWFCLYLPRERMGDDKVSILTHTYPHKALRKVKVTTCNHQVDCPLHMMSPRCLIWWFVTVEKSTMGFTMQYVLTEIGHCWSHLMYFYIYVLLSLSWTYSALCMPAVCMFWLEGYFWKCRIVYCIYCSRLTMQWCEG